MDPLAQPCPDFGLAGHGSCVGQEGHSGVEERASDLDNVQDGDDREAGNRQQCSLQFACLLVYGGKASQGDLNTT